MLVAGCKSETQQSANTDNRPTESSLFNSKPSTSDSKYSYEAVYPGDSVASDTLIIGLDAAMTGDFAKSGVSIWRGMVLAVDELNQEGGLLGQTVQIVVKDHQANPKRGVDNLKTFAEQNRLLAVVGGMHTPVLLNELETIHHNKIISLVPWAAGTSIVDNGYNPNYVFRLSVRDEYAGPYLVEKLAKAGYTKPALFLERTGWGRSNKEALNRALEQRNLSPSSPNWFSWSKKSFKDDIKRARAHGADSIIFVGNAPEGEALVKSMADLAKDSRLPILSHWGITGGNFFEKAKASIRKVQLRVLQTRSFLDPANPEYAQRERRRYCQTFGCDNTSASSIFAPVGTAHAHDLVHLLGQAVKKAGTTRRVKIQQALETLESFEGIVRTYDRPFSTTDHEALTNGDLRLAGYDSSGNLVLKELE
jgi:branched-chain amino acid transport system substrate-binding protein